MEKHVPNHSPDIIHDTCVMAGSVPSLTAFFAARLRDGTFFFSQLRLGRSWGLHQWGYHKMVALDMENPMING